VEEWSQQLMWEWRGLLLIINYEGEAGRGIKEGGEQ
jgi:hypothetical protein